MATATLSRDDVAFGRAVLLATDSLGMSAEGAFWLYDKTDNHWRYFLITSLLNRMGPREIYLRLNDALARKLSQREAEGFVFYIASPDEPVTAKLRRHVRTDRHASEPIMKARPRACVYRLSSEQGEQETKTTQRRFKRLSAELVAA